MTAEAADADTEVETEVETEIEETFSQSEFVQKLRQLADALEKGEGFEVEIAGERIAIPADAVYSVEYEGDDDEEEVEFQIKWSVPEA